MKFLRLLPIVALVGACCTHKEAQPTVQQPGTEQSDSAVAVTGPPTIVYRTRVDVGDAVPITLSADGKEIVSYPHPSDLRAGDAYATPTPLGEGYLLDNRGIGPNTVFLKWTYAEYAALPQVPTLLELQDAITVRDPFAEIYDCGLRNNYTDPLKDLSELVRSGMLLRRCKRIK